MWYYSNVFPSGRGGQGKNSGRGNPPVARRCGGAAEEDGSLQIMPQDKHMTPPRAPTEGDVSVCIGA